MLPALVSRFRRVRMLGQGGMGVVYEAFDEELGATVALKTILSRTPEALARLKQEFRVLQDVHHPNLVTLGELVTEGEECFFTMEFVEGRDFIAAVRGFQGSDSETESFPQGSGNESLDLGYAETGRVNLADALETEAILARVREDDRAAAGFDETRLRSTLAQLADGLNALHTAGLVHRDIKPANVIVTPEGRVVLLDFGLVANTRDERSGDNVVGTPAYMAPEQAATAALSPAADWYSVGVMLYEALTGRVPFIGASLEVLLRKQREQPVPPSSLARNVPPDLDALCMALLRFDPTQRPGGPRLLRDLGVKNPGAIAASQTQKIPFVGRGSELNGLERAFQEARNGAIVMLVKGESGMGKSCLVRRFIERSSVTEPGLLVLTGRCYEREAVAYKAVDGVIDSLARFLARLPSEEAYGWLPTRIEPLVQVFPVLRRVRAIAEQSKAFSLDPPQMDQGELRGRAFAALREMLTRIGSRRPMIVSIDDLQWADGDSLALLGDVLRAPEAPPLLLVATVRSGPTIDASERFREALDRTGTELREINLWRLPATQARELAAVLLARAAPESRLSAETIAEEADGHPLFIDALVRHAMDGGASGAGEARGVVRLEDALWSRVQNLEPAARELIELLAIAGTPLSQGVLARAAGGVASAFAENVAFLRVAHLVTITGGRGSDTIDTYHDKVRSAVTSHLDDAAKIVGHRRIALALETAETRDLEALYTHWSGAKDDVRAATYAEAAADRAVQTLAFDHAAMLYEAAIELGAGDPAARTTIHEKLGDAYASAGRGPLAARAYNDAAAGLSNARALDLRSRSAAELLRSGHFDEGLDAIAVVLSEVGVRLARSPVTAVMTILFWRALLLVRGLGFREREASRISASELMRVDVCTSIGRHIGFVTVTVAAAFHQRYLISALRCGEPTRVLLALGSELVYSSALGTRAWDRRAAPLIARTRKLADSIGDGRASALTSASVALARYLGTDDFRGTLEACDATATALREHAGVAWELALSQLYALFSLVYLGRWDELVVRHEQVLRDARARGDLFSVAYCSTGVLVSAWLAKDDPALARTHIARAVHMWSKRGFHIVHYHELLGLTLVDLYEGRGAEALLRIDRTWPKLQRSFFLEVQMVRTEGLDARARAVLAAARAKKGVERTRLVARARKIARQIRKERTRFGDALAGMIEACASHLEGDRAATTRLLAEAASACGVANMAIHATVARWCLASLDGPASVPDAPVRDFARVVALLAPPFGPKRR